MERSRASLLGALALALLLGVPFGCGRGEQTPVEWRTSHTLPENFPDDVTIYPKAALETVVAGNGAIVVWRTADPLQAVKDYYVRELSAKGWKVSTYPGLAAPWMGEGGITLIATKWGRQVSLALGEDGDKTAITA